jgi:hypothetical protein
VSRVIALDGWDPERFGALRRAYPESIWWVRLPADADVTEPARAGAGVIQLVGRDGRFLGDLIARAHDRLVAARCRDQVTVVASGGVVAADQVPKAIACGADAVGLDVAIWTALQGTGTAPTIPRFSQQWGTWRIINLAASWRDQLIEVLGAMGLREARRLRGERGRLLLQDELEREAFGGIPGYHGDR